MTQIRFEMSGGYAGTFASRPLSCQVTVDDLPEPEQRALRELLEGAGLSSPPSPGVPDGLEYRLTVTTAAGTRAFAFRDPGVPPAVRPLLQHLQQRAIAQRAGQSYG